MSIAAEYRLVTMLTEILKPTEARIVATRSTPNGNGHHSVIVEPEGYDLFLSLIHI